MFKSNCPTCNRERTYKTKQGWEKGQVKNCKSCSNSIKSGGIGYTLYCKCGKLKYEKSSTYCYSCHLEQSKKYTFLYRLRRYGVTQEWYEKEIEKGCSICRAQLSAYSSNKRERGHIDHDHKTGIVRGILCDLCNKGLGQFKDSIKNLENAITYLSKDKNKNK